MKNPAERRKQAAAFKAEALRVTRESWSTPAAALRGPADRGRAAGWQRLLRPPRLVR